MAESEEKLTTEERVKRSVRRTLTGATLVLLILGVLGGWGWFGLYTLEPGQAAVLLLLGRHNGTVTQDGLHWTLPPPLVERAIVNYSELRNEDFGFRGRESEDTPRTELEEASMQTSDNNIVRVSFAVQYTIKDAFQARFRVADPGPVVRDAAQAAMREVVGHMTVDGVLRQQRAMVTADVSRLLQDILDSYEAGLDVQGVQLQEVQPPAEVRAAFEDVVAANQDASRLVNEADGYRNELIPRARAEGAELRAGAEGYRDARVAEATGEAERFKALAVEYRKAPEVTQQRLYLETMETVLQDVDKVIIEKGTTQVVPVLPLGRSNGAAQP
jgi:membrane protease subunit HflK